MSTDSTNVIPGTNPLPSQPVDAAGGAPGDYGQQVLDLFKYGIGAAASYKVQQLTAQNNNLPVQTVNGKTSFAGQASGNVANGLTIGGMNTTELMLIAGALVIGAVLLLRSRG